MLVTCNLKKGPFFVYDKTPLKTTSSGLQTVNFKNNSLPHYFSQPTSTSLSQNRVEFNNSFCGNTFSQTSGFNPVFMNTVNIPNINFLSSFSNVEGESNDNVERVNQFGGNQVNFNFASK